MRTPLAFCLCLVLPAAAAAGDGAGAKTTYQTQAVTRGPAQVVIRGTGQLQPEDLVDVGAQVAGVISKLGTDPDNPKKKIDFNSVVKKDTILAQIDPTLYQVEVEKAQANLARARAELNVSKARFDQAQRAWDRVRAAGKAVSAADLDAARSNFEVARANLDVGKVAVLQAETVLRNAEINLSYTTIRAPVDGVVIDRRANVGQSVSAALNAPSLFVIATDLRKLQIWVSVAEADVVHITRGQAVTFTVPAYPEQTFKARVALDQPRLNAVMTRNVVTYIVVLETDNPNRKLLPFMTAQVSFVSGAKKDALRVPNAALRWRPHLRQVAEKDRAAFQAGLHLELPVVWVVDKGLVRMVCLKTGVTDGTLTEVVAGDLREGDRVVTGTDVEPGKDSGK
jgi:HlyD family secretion protein